MSGRTFRITIALEDGESRCVLSDGSCDLVGELADVFLDTSQRGMGKLLDILQQVGALATPEEKLH
jgi:hypothetical protein